MKQLRIDTECVAYDTVNEVVSIFTDYYIAKAACDPNELRMILQRGLTTKSFSLLKTFVYNWMTNPDKPLPLNVEPVRLSL